MEIRREAFCLKRMGAIGQPFFSLKNKCHTWLQIGCGRVYSSSGFSSTTVTAVWSTLKCSNLAPFSFSLLKAGSSNIRLIIFSSNFWSRSFCPSLVKLVQMVPDRGTLLGQVLWVNMYHGQHCRHLFTIPFIASSPDVCRVQEGQSCPKLMTKTFPHQEADSCHVFFVFPVPLREMKRVRISVSQIQITRKF